MSIVRLVRPPNATHGLPRIFTQAELPPFYAETRPRRVIRRLQAIVSLGFLTGSLIRNGKRTEWSPIRSVIISK